MEVRITPKLINIWKLLSYQNYNQRGKYIITQSKDKKCIIAIDTKTNMPLTSDHNILCISTFDIQNQKTTTFQHNDQTKLLTAFAEHFNLHDYEEVIGYDFSSGLNSVISQSLLKDLPQQPFISAKKTDLKQLLGQLTKNLTQNNQGTLSQWGQQLLNSTKPHPRKTNYQLQNEDNTQAIIENNLYNLNTIKALYEKMSRLLF